MLRRAEREVGRLPPTAISRAPDGRATVWLRPPDDRPIPASGGLHPDLYLRGAGDWIIVPPALTITGERVEWIVPPNETGFATVPGPWGYVLTDPEAACRTFAERQEVS